MYIEEQFAARVYLQNTNAKAFQDFVYDHQTGWVNAEMIITEQELAFREKEGKILFATEALLLAPFRRVEILKPTFHVYTPVSKSKLEIALVFLVRHIIGAAKISCDVRVGYVMDYRQTPKPLPSLVFCNTLAMQGESLVLF